MALLAMPIAFQLAKILNPQRPIKHLFIQMNLGLVYGSISDQDSKICHVGSEKDCWKTKLKYTPHLQMRAMRKYNANTMPPDFPWHCP